MNHVSLIGLSLRYLSLSQNCSYAELKYVGMHETKGNSHYWDI